MIKEIAEAIGFDNRFLCEEFNSSICYSFDESDIPMIKEMLELSKTKEGREARRKIYSKDTCEVIERWMKIFSKLAEHNGANSGNIKNQMVRMYKRTNYIVLKAKAEACHPELEQYLYSKMFLPTDAMPNEEDKFTATDCILFLEYIIGKHDLSLNEICGLYWCFKEMRDSKINKEFINELHAMSRENKEAMFNNVKKYLEHQRKLDNNSEYLNAIQELVRIESGQGKLKDQKKVRPLIKNIADIMDVEAKGIYSGHEYNFGCLDKLTGKANETETIEDDFKESREIFEQAIAWYSRLVVKRSFIPVNNDNITILEIGYRTRFGMDMF